MFGNINIRENRLLVIGIGIGLMLGAGAPYEGLRYGLAFFGLFLIILRCAAQIEWPDRMADDNPTHGPKE